MIHYINSREPSLHGVTSGIVVTWDVMLNVSKIKPWEYLYLVTFIRLFPALLEADGLFKVFIFLQIVLFVSFM